MEGEEHSAQSSLPSPLGSERSRYASLSPKCVITVYTTGCITVVYTAGCGTGRRRETCSTYKGYLGGIYTQEGYPPIHTGRHIHTQGGIPPRVYPGIASLVYNGV